MATILEMRRLALLLRTPESKPRDRAQISFSSPMPEQHRRQPLLGSDGFLSTVFSLEENCFCPTPICCANLVDFGQLPPSLGASIDFDGLPTEKPPLQVDWCDIIKNFPGAIKNYPITVHQRPRHYLILGNRGC